MFGFSLRLEQAGERLESVDHREDPHDTPLVDGDDAAVLVSAISTATFLTSAGPGLTS